MLRRKASDPAFLRENLRAALLAGTACEVDIVLTADGEAFCLHDLNLDRETTGVGRASRATRAQVERLRQRGPDWHVLDDPPLFLDEIVDIVRGMGTQAPGLVQLDIKVPSGEIDAKALRRIGSVLGDMAPAFVAGGYDWAAIQRLADAAPGLSRGFDPLAFYPRDCSLDADAFRRLGEKTFSTSPDADIFYLEARLVLAGLSKGVNLIGMVNGDGAMVDCWTLDAGRPRLREDIALLLQAGCNQITTNDPDALKTVIRELLPC
jgi:glycerophosphoryl diester phosphodiesterase